MDQAPVTMSMIGPVAVVVVDDGADNTLDINIINSLLSALAWIHRCGEVLGVGASTGKAS